MKTIVIALFALTYVLMLSVPKYRHFFALAVAGIYVVLGAVAPVEALGAIDWNVILMLAGTMGTVYLCIESQMPAAVADIMVNKLKKVISGTSTSIFKMDVVKTCLKVPCARNA